MYVVDYIADRSLGEVVKQRLGIPATEENIVRHVTNATLLPPIFFENTNGSLGIPLTLAAGNATSGLMDAESGVRMGGKSTTHLCLNVGVSMASKLVTITETHLCGSGLDT